MTLIRSTDWSKRWVLLFFSTRFFNIHKDLERDTRHAQVKRHARLKQNKRLWTKQKRIFSKKWQRMMRRMPIGRIFLTTFDSHVDWCFFSLMKCLSLNWCHEEHMMLCYFVLLGSKSNEKDEERKRRYFFLFSFQCLRIYNNSYRSIKNRPLTMNEWMKKKKKKWKQEY